MNTRLQKIINYKTGGRQNLFAELLGCTPQYLAKLLKGENFGLQPVLRIVEALPELNARWLLTGEGQMLTDDGQTVIRLKALDRAERLMYYERLVPVMTAEELHKFEQWLSGNATESPFSPDMLTKLNERADERKMEINAKFAAAIAKSDRQLCRQRTARK
ncbi:MAG: hypothetical protein LUD50_06145 [Clostridia bacterium]|nr:hypothetical protein [Clostridia bacterium]